MIKIDSTGERYIDLASITQTTEIPIENLLATSYTPSLSFKFSYEEIEVNDSSSSLYFTQNEHKVLICVYGPRESRMRDKYKAEEAIVEVYTKFNTEISRERNKKVNTTIQNFCESLIFLEQYPRCQINIVINVLSYPSDNEYLLLSTILNGLMLALSISGVDLKTFALTKACIEDNHNILYTLDANTPDNILLVESNTPLNLNLYKRFFEQSKEEVKILYERFKAALFKKLNLSSA